jgi:SAM-dependent methyltransferase
MTESYIIRGGEAGASRLSVLCQAMAEATGQLLDRVGVPAGGRILDAGCGVGEVTYELALRAGPSGRAVGVDLDAAKIDQARAGAPVGAEFHVGDLGMAEALGPFDLVYARFLLSHLTDPGQALEAFLAALRPGGWLVVEDVDFAAHVCWPPRPAFDRYVGWYRAAGQARGADPDIGPKLAAMLRDAGLAEVGARIAQPAGLEGPVKAMAALTLAGIREAVIAMDVPADLVAADLADLEAAREDPGVLMTLPRVFQAWGRKPVQ